MEKLKEHHISFKNAFAGLFLAITGQPNFKIHFFFSISAIFLAFILEIERYEMLIILMLIIFGLGSEMINTAIEEMTDLITKEYRQEAKAAKDVSAGMMLLIAIGSAFVGAVIFLPRIIQLLK